MCDHLVVGVTTDELLIDYKKKQSVIPFTERCEIVRGIRYVDAVVGQANMDKFGAWERLKFDLMFVGDDWYQTPKWERIESELKAVNVRVIYFPYTQGTSSTLINSVFMEKRRDTVPPAKG